MSDTAPKKDWMVEPNVPDFTYPATPHDRVLIVEGKKFYVYAGFLSTSSEFFRALFSSGFKEASEQEIEIKDISSDHFELFLKCLFPWKKTVEITKDNYIAIIDFSHRFLSSPVSANCMEFIQEKFADLDKIDLLEVAFKYNIEFLKKKVADFLTTEESGGIYSQCTSATCDTQMTECYKCKQKLRLSEGFPLEKCLVIVRQKERIKSLSTEIQVFLLHALLDKANNCPL